MDHNSGIALFDVDIIIQDRVHSLFNHKITRSNPHRFKTSVCAFIFQAVLNFIYMKLKPQKKELMIVIQE